MTDQIQLGNILFEIESDLPIHWKTIDAQFRCTGDCQLRRIPVAIHAVDALPEDEGSLIYRNSDMEFRIAQGFEMRTHLMRINSGYKVYAKSKWDRTTHQIWYLRSSNYWTNPNFSFWVLLHLENHLMDSAGMVLHCCWLEYRGAGILLTAPSGTGKTTHGNLWRKCFDAQIINGDRALIQRVDGQWVVRGYPFHGSAQECENRTMPLKAIVILRQGMEDRIQELSPVEKVRLLLSECTVSFYDKKRINQALDLLTDLIDRTMVLMLHCTMEDRAAVTLYEYLYPDEIREG